MEIPMALQVVVFLASLAIIVLVACLVPLGFQARRIAEKMQCTLEEFKADAHYVKQQTEELISNLNELSRRANQEMDDVSHMIRTARKWTERVDEIVAEVQPPVFALARNFNLIRTGVGKFMQVLLHSNHHGRTQR